MNILIHWSDDYSLNIKRIDEQHKKLVEMINRVYDSIIRNEEDDVLDQVISDMIDYAFVHFKNEEQYFEQFSYDDAIHHIAEHKFFLKKAKKFREEHKSHHAELKHEVMAFLQKWLTNHIMHSDRKYKDCFLKGGIK